MPKSKARKNVDENFKVAAVQRLQTGGVLANDLAKELGVSIWSLRKWSRQYRKTTAAGAGAAGEPAVPAAAPEELPAKPSSEPPVVDGGLIAAIARIELEISSLDKQRQALKMAVEILRQRSGATPGWFPGLHIRRSDVVGVRITVRQILPRIRSGPTPPIGRGQRLEPLWRAPQGWPPSVAYSYRTRRNIFRG